MRSRLASNWRIALAWACLVYPWLHVGARGPSAVIEPRLVTLLCTAALLALCASRDGCRTPRGVLPFAMVFGVALWAANAAATEQWLPSPGIVGAWGGLVVIVVCSLLPGWLASSDTPVRRDAATWIAWAWLTAGAVSSVIALMQIAGVSDLLGPLAAPSPMRHAFGNLRQKNHYATLANIALLSLGWLSAYGRPLPRGVCVAGALLLCGGVAASASRMGALQLLAVGVLIVVWHRRSDRPIGWLVAAGAAYAAAALVLLATVPADSPAPGILRRLVEGEAGCERRGLLWANVIEITRHRPWTGWGWEGMGYGMYAVPLPVRYCAYTTNAHNVVLQLAVDSGWPVALAFCAGVLAWVWRSRPWAASSPAHRLAWGVVLLLAMHSMLEHPLWFGPFQMALGLCLGLLGSPAAWRIRAGWTLGAAVFVAGATLYAAWDWLRVSQIYLPPERRLAAYEDDTFAKASSSWLFSPLVEYARLQGLPMDAAHAGEIYERSGRVLRHLAAPLVIEKRIQSARLMKKSAEADLEDQRYRLAFPAEHAAFAERTKPAR